VSNRSIERERCSGISASHRAHRAAGHSDRRVRHAHVQQRALECRDHELAAGAEYDAASDRMSTKWRGGLLAWLLCAVLGGTVYLFTISGNTDTKATTLPATATLHFTYLGGLWKSLDLGRCAFGSKSYDIPVQVRKTAATSAATVRRANPGTSKHSGNPTVARSVIRGRQQRGRTDHGRNACNGERCRESAANYGDRNADSHGEAK
jgi:hypothetical protein